MPSVAQEAPTVQSSKKRRREDADRDNHDNSSSNNNIASEHGGAILAQHSPFVRKIIPIPSSKKQRTISDREEEAARSTSTPSPADERHDPRKPSPPTAAGTASTLQEDLPDETTRSEATVLSRTSSTNLMGRCHICFRKPSKKLDLDSFADCQGCGQRTCYVCIRECSGWSPPHPLAEGMLGGETISETPTESFMMPDADFECAVDMGRGNSGREVHHGHHRPYISQELSSDNSTPRRQQEPEGWWGGHRQMVCSRCCVERGEDGDVVCLGCLPFIEG
ncbi:hypothetical protein B0T26DRAFT_635598 [Lasiosphaeria miniovina]|uniref:Uncharacterized protein n=1 Tax=Lasiosphaeria miniovina TaxID=1954250 RepID=A0AA40EE14_9PEZI|nr:uncharacterized protein B0T26DRAFT_635598 [Lasiosphaeria miniovina]KAK0734016.1 hypothetical protein B0T26DRAFT_635598 [Lasiosphaeria miniovina]